MDSIAQEWAANAKDLATWVWHRLAVRADVYGNYWRDHATQQTVPTTAPAKSKRGQLYLDHAIIEQHFRATKTEHVIGLHAVGIDNRSRWAAIDIDCHGETSSPAEINLAAAIAWHDRLRCLGFRPLLSDSNGRGGYHLLCVFSVPVPTPKAFAFARWLTQDFARHGLPKQVETFPKQCRVEPGKYGSWLRVMGRHHTREHWSRIWDGERWLEGAAAVAFILGITGDDPARIPPESQIVQRQTQARKVTSSAPAEPLTLAERVEAYLAKLPTNLGEGMRRDDHAFTFAAFLVRDLQLDDADALTWLEVWDKKQKAEKGPARLKEIIINAHRYGQRAKGAGLVRRQQSVRAVIAQAIRVGETKA